VPIKPTRTIEPKPARRAVAARPAKGTRGAFALLGLRDALKALSAGDFSVRLGRGASDIEREVAIAFGSLAERLDLASAEVIRVSTSMARDGETRERAALQGAAGTWRELIDNVNQLADDLGAQVRAITDVSTAVTHGDLSPSIRVEARSEVPTPRGNLDQMIGKLRETMARNQEQDWLKTNLARFSGMMQGQKNIEAVSRLLMSELTPLVSAHHGAFFVRSGDGAAGEMKLVAGYAFEERKNVSSRFKVGEGLVGQCALEKKPILLTNVPGDYVRISSGLGHATPLVILVFPILFEDEVSAVVELASFRPFSPIHRVFLEQLSGSIGVVLNMIGANARTVEALQQSRSLAEELLEQSKELQTQQYELKKSNQELGAQAQSLKVSEEQLRDQRKELQQVNAQLEDKARLLVRQNRAVEGKNRELELARLALEDKASQLVLSSKYKSEFLANMSHELRTPLNSLLILAQLLADNAGGNMNAKQVEFASTIHTAGTDLLSLINDILDLSKIESGTMSLEEEELPLVGLSEYVERAFRPLALHKHLELTVTLAPELPPSLWTDPRRLQQVLKNLLANAFKFTERGGVTLEVHLATSGWSPDHPTLGGAEPVVAFSVTDTGIGIPADKQALIFQAFQQADGTTGRRYGGTGLGLSISRELARVLGGEVDVVSAPGEGSTFTLYLPGARVSAREQASVRMLPEAAEVQQPAARAALPRSREEGVADDRAGIAPGDPVLLVIDDDATRGRVVVDLAHSAGLKCLMACSGEEGLALAHEFAPAAITLDLGLPGADGWLVLDRLKHSAETRHIPVFVVSVDDTARARSLQLGALDFFRQPLDVDALLRRLLASRERGEAPLRELLVVEDNDVERQAIVELTSNEGVRVTAVASAEEALSELERKRFDCMILDLGLPGISGFELLDRLQGNSQALALPIVVYTGRELTPAETAGLAGRTEAIIVKDVCSREHLLSQTTLFLHREEATLTAGGRQMLKSVRDSDPVFARKTVLVIDDDVRNIFAVTSILERHRMKVLFAEDGRRGVELLQSSPAVALVLMDVMMPEMDGYEATRAIRGLGPYATLPIVALTAKAMKDDRAKCIAAGASDYLAKPVNVEQLLSVLRVWLY
jgi:CheY-like chemotaxis protein